jgi:tetratricopeptide (TPR) repeat protein
LRGRFRGRTFVRWATAGLVVCLILAASALDLYPALVANLERVQTVRALDIRARARNADETAWDAGWRSLCSETTPKTTELAPSSQQSLSFIALSNIDRGDYAAALEQFRVLAAQDSAAETPNASAYLAALEMNWREAAGSYQPQPTARHRRFWATIFYFAAQQALFNGDMNQAAELYRLADAGYGTQGPYGGLDLVDCLVQRGRPLEAFDAYRRALATMPPEEALAHLPRFAQLRLEALHAWRQRDPDNRQVQHWLDFYETDAAVSHSITETLRSAPAPQVALEVDLGGGRSLVGFDYREEDIETGPYLQMDFYVREGQDAGAEYTRIRQGVLNQAINGAFRWDGAPNGVRPIGWHRLLYSPNLDALRYEVKDERRWLCLNGGAIRASFGLQSNITPIVSNTPAYAQGGQALVSGGGALGHGRTWFDYATTPHPYSYVSGGHRQDEVEAMAGLWEPATGSDQVAVWLFSDSEGQACVRAVYFFAVPSL